MAMKASVFLSLFVALFAAAVAHRTIITTTTIQEEQPWQSMGGCQLEILKYPYDHCHMYLSEGQGSQSPYSDKKISLRGVVNPQEQEDHLSQCCKQLRQVDKQCRCDAIKKIAFDHQRGSQFQPARQQSTSQIMEKAESLPQMCQFQEPQQCSIQSGPF